MIRNNYVVRLALGGAVSAYGMLFVTSGIASASILPTTSFGAGPIDTIYSDTFTPPGTNVNSAGTDPNSIAGNTVAGGDGGTGGTPGATYIGSAAQPSGSTAAPDAVWDYHSGGSATITSPSGNVTSGEDGSTIDNLTLPLVPVVGQVYDLELTMMAASGTGAHALEMAFIYNNGNGHNGAAQAISNNDPIGLILDRDAVSGGGYFDIFEGTGTNNDTHFAPTSNSLTGGSVGTSVTVDEIYTPTSSTSGTESVYLNGILATGSPFTLSGLTGGITNIQFGDNRVAGGTFSNFSLTSESVPEPTALALLSAAGALALRRRRVAVHAIRSA